MPFSLEALFSNDTALRFRPYKYFLECPGCVQTLCTAGSDMASSSSSLRTIDSDRFESKGFGQTAPFIARVTAIAAAAACFAPITSEDSERTCCPFRDKQWHSVHTCSDYRSNILPFYPCKCRCSGACASEPPGSPPRYRGTKIRSHSYCAGKDCKNLSDNRSCGPNADKTFRPL